MLRYYEALTSELLLTNLMVLPLLGRSPQPYESRYRWVDQEKISKLERQWERMVPSALWKIYKALPSWPLEDFFETLQRLLACADANGFWQSSIGDEDLVFLAQQILAQRCRWGRGCLRDFRKVYESEWLSAQRLGQIYAVDLNLERDSSFRDCWLDQYYQNSAYIDLMRADNFFLQSFRQDSWGGNFMQGSPPLQRSEECLEAYKRYHQLYDPDLRPNVFQLAVQVRLFIYLTQAASATSDFMEVMGFLFHRTEPIVLKKWPMLMSMLGTIYRRGTLSLKIDRTQAMKLYQRYEDFYGMSRTLWFGTPPFQRRMLSKASEYAARAAFGLSQGVDLGKIRPVFSELSIHRTAALMHLLDLFEAAKDSKDASYIFEAPWREVCEQHWLQVQQRFNKVSTYCPERPQDDAVTKNGRLDQWPYHTLWEFQLDLEDKRRLDPQWREALQTPEICTRLSFLQSGMVVNVSDELCGEVGQIIQLCEDNETGYKYLKRYGYPLYPIEWFQVSTNVTSGTKLRTQQYYVKKKQSWVPFSAIVTVEWLPI